jgi:hypothetical protein
MRECASRTKTESVLRSWPGEKDGRNVLVVAKSSKERRVVYISPVDAERSGAMLVCVTGVNVGVLVGESKILGLSLGGPVLTR